MKTSTHFLLFAATAGACYCPLALQAQSSVSYTGTTYTQNFDTFPYTPGSDVNTANPVTLNGTQYTFNGGAYTTNTSAVGTVDFAASVDTSGTATTSGTGGYGLTTGMPGWYGAGQTLYKGGAHSGDQTTGGLLSFGTTGGAGSLDSNRSLGLLATSTTGVTFFGLKLINNTGKTMNSFNLNFTAELWRQQTVAKPLAFGYYVDSTVADTIPYLNAGSSTTVGSVTGTNIGTISFATGTSTGTTVNTTGPLATSASNNTINSANWTNGAALWVVWEETTNAGGGQGIGIDNLTFSTAAVPEPSTYAIVGLAICGLLCFRIRSVKMAR